MLANCFICPSPQEEERCIGNQYAVASQPHLRAIYAIAMRRPQISSPTCQTKWRESTHAGEAYLRHYAKLATEPLRKHACCAFAIRTARASNSSANGGMQNANLLFKPQARLLPPTSRSRPRTRCQAALAVRLALHSSIDLIDAKTRQFNGDHRELMRIVERKKLYR